MWGECEAMSDVCCVFLGHYHLLTMGEAYCLILGSTDYIIEAATLEEAQAKAETLIREWEA